MPQRHGRGERVAAIGMAVIQRLLAQVRTEKRGEYALGSNGRGHGQVAAGDAFAQAQQVRAQATLFGREQRAGAAEASRNFIADQQHAGLVAGLA
jgi:hypothetical protein